jgi:truncated hemoglobin YjbI
MLSARRRPIAVDRSLMTTTLFEHCGGDPALRRLAHVFYDGIIADPLLAPLFGAQQPDHVDHLTWFTAEWWMGRTGSPAILASRT